MKAKLLFYYDYLIKFPNRNTGFIFKVNVCQCKHGLFRIIILKETFVVMCLASHFDINKNRKLIVVHRDIYYAKNIKIFVSAEF